VPKPPARATHTPRYTTRPRRNAPSLVNIRLAGRGAGLQLIRPADETVRLRVVELTMLVAELETQLLKWAEL